MKEATGEANLTSITIIFMGICLSVFYVIIPQLLNSMRDRACCVQFDGEVDLDKGLCRLSSYYNKGHEEESKDIHAYALKGFKMHCDK